MEPTTKQLAQRVLRQERAAFATAAASALTALDLPSPNSPRALDLAWINAMPDERRDRLTPVLTQTVNDAAGILLSADEHIQALGSVLSADAMLPLPALTLARAAQEACLLLCYLTDPAVPPPLRLARGAALRLHTAQENQKTLRLFGEAVDTDLARDAAEGVDGLQRYLTNAGFELRYDRENQYVTAVTCDGQRSPLTPKTTDLSAQYIPAAHNLWVIGSGATHSRTWLSQGLEGPWSTVVAAVVLPLLDVADALTDTLCGYVGLDSAPLHAKTHLRRVAIYRNLGDTAPVASWTDYAAATVPPA